MKREPNIFRKTFAAISLLSMLFAATYTCQESTIQEFTAQDTERLDQLLCEQKWTEKEIWHALCNAYFRAVEKLLQRKSSDKAPVPCNHTQTIEYLRDTGFYLERPQNECGAIVRISIRTNAIKALALLTYKATIFTIPIITITPALTNQCVCSPLNLAIVCDNYEIVEKLLQAGTQVNEKEGTDFFPLAYAVKQGQLAILEPLIKNGARTDRRYGDSGESLLHLAAEHGHLKVLEILLVQGIPVDQKNNNGQTPLFTAVRSGHLPIVKFLITTGARIDITDKNGNSLLHAAMHGGDSNIKMAKFLLKQGLNPNQTNNDGHPPLFSAAKSDSLQLVKLLLHTSARADIVTPTSYTVLHAACTAQASNVLEFLLARKVSISPNHQTVEGKTPLHQAAYDAELDHIQLLINAGARPDILDKKGDSPLHDLLKIDAWDCSAHIEYLLDQGAEINSTNFKGKQPLDIALGSDLLAPAATLLKRGADYGPGHIQQIVTHEDFGHVIWSLLPHIFAQSQTKQIYWHSAVLTGAVQKNRRNLDNWATSREGRACMLIQLLPSIDLRQFSSLEELKVVLSEYLPEDLVNEFCALEGLPLRKAKRRVAREDESIQEDVNQLEESLKGQKRDRESSTAQQTAEDSNNPRPGKRHRGE